MKEILEALYQELKTKKGIGGLNWDDSHNPSKTMRSYVWCKANIEDHILDDYDLWKGLVQLFKDYGVAYYMGIDTFLEEFGKFYREVQEGKRTLID